VARRRRTPLALSARADADFERIANALSVPVFLIDLTTYRIRLANDMAAALLGASRAELVDRPVADFYVGTEAEGAQGAMSALRSGAIDGYRAHRRVRRVDGQEIEASVWSRALGSDAMRTALTFLVPGSDAATLASTVPAFISQLSPALVCILDAEWRVTWVNVDVEDVLGYTAHDYEGVPLLGAAHPDDLPAVLDAIDEMQARRQSKMVCTRLRRADGGWRPMDCLLVPIELAEPARYGLFAGPAPPTEGRPFDQAARVSELEHHMLRIATQLRAAGVAEVGAVPDLSGLDQFSELSPRQVEILTRLLRGERVATIAAELFLSPTTVRNHLTAVFRKFGVHSQVELLALLRSPPDRPVA
jgi:PAS domain S-box-containing protein